MKALLFKMNLENGTYSKMDERLVVDYSLAPIVFEDTMVIDTLHINSSYEVADEYIAIDSGCSQFDNYRDIAIIEKETYKAENKDTFTSLIYSLQEEAYNREIKEASKTARAVIVVAVRLKIRDMDIVGQYLIICK